MLDDPSPDGIAGDLVRMVHEFGVIALGQDASQGGNGLLQAA